MRSSKIKKKSRSTRAKKSKKTVKTKRASISASDTQTTTLFMNGQSQAVRIPKEFRIAGKKVYIKRSGNCIILIPADDPWRSLLDTVGKFSDDFMRDGREQPPEQEREDIFL